MQYRLWLRICSTIVPISRHKNIMFMGTYPGLFLQWKMELKLARVEMTDLITVIFRGV
jgi:hypothetical protein